MQQFYTLLISERDIDAICKYLYTDIFENIQETIQFDPDHDTSSVLWEEAERLQSAMESDGIEIELDSCHHFLEVGYAAHCGSLGVTMA